MWASVVNGGYSVEQTMVVEWPLVHWSHAGCYGQQHGWFYVNDDDGQGGPRAAGPATLNNPHEQIKRD